MSICSLKTLKYNIIPRMKDKAIQERGTNYYISAVAFTKKGNFLDIAYNKHRLFYEYINARSSSYQRGVDKHAEQHLIQKYKKKIDTIYILRVSKTGRQLPIHPCPICSALGKKYQIKIIPLHEEVGFI